MKDTEIPREEWVSFCRAFAREHHGWLATVRSAPRRLRFPPRRPRALVRDRVFQDLRAQRKSGGELEFVVVTGEQSERALHCVERPRHLWLEATRSGAHKGLRIDDEQGNSLLVEFRVAARPESLDGVAPREI